MVEDTVLAGVIYKIVGYYVVVFFPKLKNIIIISGVAVFISIFFWSIR